MTEVEYTERVLDHLENRDLQVADREMNEVDEATEWTEHRLERLSGYTYFELRAGDYRAIISWDRDAIYSGSRRSVIAGPSTNGTSRRNEGWRDGGIEKGTRKGHRLASRVRSNECSDGN